MEELHHWGFWLRPAPLCLVVRLLVVVVVVVVVASSQPAISCNVCLSVCQSVCLSVCLSGLSPPATSIFSFTRGFFFRRSKSLRELFFPFLFFFSFLFSFSVSFLSDCLYRLPPPSLPILF